MIFDYDNQNYECVAKEIEDAVSCLFDDPHQIENQEIENIHRNFERITNQNTESNLYTLIKKCTRESIKESNEVFKNVVIWREENLLTYDAIQLAKESLYFSDGWDTLDFKHEFQAIYIAAYLRTIEELGNRKEKSQHFRSRIAYFEFLTNLKKENPGLHSIISGYLAEIRRVSPFDLQDNPFEEIEFERYVPLADKMWEKLCRKAFYRIKGSFHLDARASTMDCFFKSFLFCYRSIFLLAQHDLEVIFQEPRSRQEMYSDLGMNSYAD